MWDVSGMQHLYLNKYKFFFSHLTSLLRLKKCIQLGKVKKKFFFIVLNKSCKLYTI